MRRDPRTLGWAVVLLAVGVVSCAVPLFDLLGYEFSFVIGIVAAFAGAHLGAARVWRARMAAPPSERAAAEARPARTVFALWARATARVWALLLLPLAAILVNAFRVRNCNLADGFAWFAVLPLASAALGAASGVAIGLVRPFRRRGAATVLALAAIVSSLALAVWRFYAAPPINAYDPFGGYFPGTLYDEEVAIPRALLWARLYHAACGLAILSACALFLDGERLALRLRAARDRSRQAAFLLAAAALALGLGAAHARLGFAYSAGDIARGLGASRETEHFLLLYSPSGPFARDIDLYAADHEFRWAELRARFGVEPGGKVRSYLFSSSAEKQTYLGASHTSIAKPWRLEIYLQADGWPHPVLAHELMHVFAGAFGDPIFRASRHGLAFNVGLIEGVATAAAWSGSPLTPHEQVKVARALGVEPPLEAVLSTRFFAYAGTAAYATAGSFCRFLLERSGAAPLEQVYRAGGTDSSWRAAYGVPLAALASEWRAYIDRVEVAPRELELARQRLARPSVFRRVCAHELALRREAAHHAAQGGDRSRALALFDSICHDEPDDPRPWVEKLELMQQGGSGDEIVRSARALLAHPKAGPAERARAELALGDRALAQGDRKDALTHYDAAAALPLDEAEARLTTVKQVAAHESPGPVADLLIAFLVPPGGARDASVDLYTAQRLVEAKPERALFRYLLARQLSQRSRFLEALEAYRIALVLELPDERFVREALRQEGLAAVRAQRPDDARRVFTQLAQPGEPEGARLEADEWLRRLAFASRR